MLYEFKSCKEQDKDFIIDKLVEYNLSQVAPTQDELFTDLSFKLEEKGEIIAGIIARMYCWNVVYIDTLWVNESHRKQNIGTHLLHKVEAVAKEKGAYLIHLDTFDFQAKEFYERYGYTVFGKLDDCPKGHCRYFMKKNF